MEEERMEFFTEPLLQFGYEQCLHDPKDGLFLFGPLVDERKPAQIRVGVVGTAEGISLYKGWVKGVTGYLPPLKDESPHHLAFPGFEAVFRTSWPATPVVEVPVSAADISRLLRLSDRHLAVYETVSLFADPIRRKLREDDASVDVWFVVVPEEVYQLGRPRSLLRRSERIDIAGRLRPRQAQRLLREPSMFAEDMAEAEVQRYEVNFHHQLKARLIDVRAVVQIVRDTSLVSPDVTTKGRSRRLQDPATLAWNLCTTSYFKAGGRPWKLATVREGVCYVGLVFKMSTADVAEGNACCGAQMFLDSGDGLVFKGAMGPWYSRELKEFHLPEDEAKSLIEVVVRSYAEVHDGNPPKELFIHGRTRFNDAEWAGFRAGAPSSTNLVGVRITRSQEMKVFRSGTTPVLRGSAYRINRMRALLWTMGYIPQLKTYPGREVPNPLAIEICRGDADINVVMQDVMGLTKVNFNACVFADGLPVTLRFANAVGEILTAAPQVDGPPLPFRHYI